MAKFTLILLNLQQNDKGQCRVLSNRKQKIGTQTSDFQHL